MGKVISVGGQKGGVGKSTIAINLVVCLINEGYKTVLVDADTQATSGLFTHIRREKFDQTGYTYVQLIGRSLTELNNLADQYDYVIVDVGGKDDESQRYALIHSDAVILPFEPRNESIDTLDTMIELVIGIRSRANPDFKAFSVINKADSVGHYNNAAQEALIEENDTITYIKAPIVERKAFVHASSQGKGIIESNGRKAIYEFRKFFEAVMGNL